MELGLETILYKEYSNDGQEISGGEAQKVAIARAIYKDAPVVILDEPTAALDPLAEYEIYSRFSELIGEKGVIYISHRLSSCRFCEDIVVIEHGQVIEQGSHENLLAQRGRYAHLWSAQNSIIVKSEGFTSFASLFCLFLPYRCLGIVLNKMKNMELSVYDTQFNLVTTHTFYRAIECMGSIMGHIIVKNY